MNVTLVTPHRHGGMLHYTSQLANAMAERADVTQFVVSGADSKVFSDRVDLRELPLPVEVSELGPSTVSGLRTVYRRLKRVESDVVHVTSGQELIPFVLPAVRDRPFVYTSHDIYYHSGEFSLRGSVVQQLLVRYADRVVVHGEYNVEQFARKFGSAEKAFEITHGDYGMFDSYCDDPTTYEPELLFFGRIAPYKGLDVLLEAERLLADRVDDFRIVVAGEGELDEFCRERIAESDHVRLLNEYVADETVCELFSRCRAVVLPYRDASQSGVLPIAYSFEKPVVATDVGTNPELVAHEETGLLVDPENPRQLAAACERLLTDREWARELGAVAHRFGEREMSWDDTAGRLLGMYDSLR